MIETCSMSSTLERVRRSVARQSSDVVLRRDLLHLGSSARVDAALAEMMRLQRLIRLGMGVYAKTIKTPQGDRVIREGFTSLAEEALERLGVEYELHPGIVRYRAGLSDQVPARLVIAPKHRVSRKLSVGRLSVNYVRNFRKPGLSGSQV